MIEISRGLKFGVCNCGKPHAYSPTARKGEFFYRGEKKVGRAIVKKKNSWIFIGSALARKEDESFFLLDSAMNSGHEISPFWPPNSIKLSFVFINFFYSG